MASSSTDRLRQLVYGFAVTKVVNLPHAVVAGITDLHMEHRFSVDGPMSPALDLVFTCCCAFDREVAAGLSERTATKHLRACVLSAMDTDPGWQAWQETAGAE